VYNEEIRLSDGVQILVDECDMEESSAGGYIHVYTEMRKGHRYTWTINAMAIEYYLGLIYPLLCETATELVYAPPFLGGTKGLF
jgi:hypothetical protein